MKFEVNIVTADGGTRKAEFECPYDATAVVESHVTANVLQPGESIKRVPAYTHTDAHDHDRDMKAMVPDIVRLVQMPDVA